MSFFFTFTADITFEPTIVGKSSIEHCLHWIWNTMHITTKNVKLRIKETNNNYNNKKWKTKSA